MAETVDIPEPRGLPFLGNITSIDNEFPLGSLVSLADQYGTKLTYFSSKDHSANDC